MFECYICGHKSVIWKSDFDYEDFGMEGNGIVHEFMCSNCGCTYVVFDEGNTDEDSTG